MSIKWTELTLNWNKNTPKTSVKISAVNKERLTTNTLEILIMRGNVI